MPRAQAQYLRIFDQAGNTSHRWQNYYGSSTVSYDGASWVYVPFEADGFTAGSSGEETNITVTMPATKPLVTVFDAAREGASFLELSVYQFDAIAGNSSPPSDQILVARFTGQAVGGTSGLTSQTLQLGSALSPVGVQIPPLKLTTEIMGMGCRL